MRNWTSWIVFWVVFLHGVFFLTKPMIPTPFSTTDWFLDHGGQSIWGCVFLISGVLKLLCVSRLNWGTRFMLHLPQSVTVLIMATGAFARWIELDGAAAERVELGAVYVIPLALINVISMRDEVTRLRRERYLDEL